MNLVFMLTTRDPKDNYAEALCFDSKATAIEAADAVLRDFIEADGWRIADLGLQPFTGALGGRTVMASVYVAESEPIARVFSQDIMPYQVFSKGEWEPPK